VGFEHVSEVAVATSNMVSNPAREANQSGSQEGKDEPVVDAEVNELFDGVLGRLVISRKQCGTMQERR
jgi:hypothetical protein